MPRVGGLSYPRRSRSWRAGAAAPPRAGACSPVERATAAREAAPGRLDSSQRSNMRLLIIEDESLLADRLAATCREHGYVVDVAGDGEHGDFLLGTEAYDAVVLDLGLPLVDGLTLLERWRAGGIAVPVLVLTARSSWSEKVRGIDGGADDYLTKPFQMEELLARLRALLRRASGRLTPELRSGGLVLDPRT